MQFCIISPTSGLNRYSILSTRHLLLPQIESYDYWDFYSARRAQGDHIILDNGAYEGKMDVDLFLKRIELIKPQVAVLPDHLGEPWKRTFDSAIKFWEQYQHHFPNTDWMYVPSGTKNGIMEFIEGLLEVINISKINPTFFTWIGLPRALATHISPDPLMRVNVCGYIKEHHPHVTVHALGMSNGNTNELPLLAKAGCESVDSSCAVWRGWNEHSLTNPADFTSWNQHGTDVDFDAPYHNNPEKHFLILDNLEACNVDVSAARAWANDNQRRKTVVGGKND